MSGHVSSGGTEISRVDCWSTRVHVPLYPEQGPYLVTMMFGPSVHGERHAFPTAHAVMDDYGNLVITRSWQ